MKHLIKGWRTRKGCDYGIYASLAMYIRANQDTPEIDRYSSLSFFALPELFFRMAWGTGTRCNQYARLLVLLDSVISCSISRTPFL